MYQAIKYWGKRWDEAGLINFIIFPSMIKFIQILVYLYSIPTLIVSLLFGRILFTLSSTFLANIGIVHQITIDQIYIAIGILMSILISYLLITEYGTVVILDTATERLGKYEAYFIPIRFRYQNRVHWSDISSVDKVNLYQELVVDDEYAAMKWYIRIENEGGKSNY